MIASVSPHSGARPGIARARAESAGARGDWRSKGVDARAIVHASFPLLETSFLLRLPGPRRLTCAAPAAAMLASAAALPSSSSSPLPAPVWMPSPALLPAPVLAPLPQPAPADALPADSPLAAAARALAVVLEDEDFVGVSKPCDVRMDGAHAVTMERLLAARFGAGALHHCHQLDFATSGALLYGARRGRGL